jgi:hypothetical protein
LALSLPGSADFLKRYSAKAAAAGIDPLGFAWGPFAYAAGQVLTEAVAETKSLDHDKLAAYMHKAKFNTVAGNFSFAQDGEWSQTRQVWTQFQNVQPNNLDQFRDGKVQPIVWPIESKSGDLMRARNDAGDRCLGLGVSCPASIRVWRREAMETHFVARSRRCRLRIRAVLCRIHVAGNRRQRL